MKRKKKLQLYEEKITVHSKEKIFISKIKTHDFKLKLR
jgi:hypothetical protein